MPSHSNRRANRRSPPSLAGGNPAVRDALLEVVDKQLKANDPPEVARTLDRLIQGGMREDQARLYIAFAVLIEANDLMATEKPYDASRYIANLKRLPHLPFEKD